MNCQRCDNEIDSKANGYSSGHAADCDATDRIEDEHAIGEHADFMDMDCRECVDEARTLGMVR